MELLTEAILTPNERLTVERWLRDAADRLGLRDWAITVEQDHPNEGDHAAAMWTDYGSRRMRVWCRADLPTLSLDMQRQTLVHELMHVHLEDLDWYLEKTLPELLGKPAWSAVKQAVQLHSEHAVEAIACAVAQFFPMIEWPEVPPAESTLTQQEGTA
ncbi:MAG TPA: hypothetical protein VFM74_04590 [Candidatus Limnocylindria bacterium]|nr:hypothetical protein [Candidatus Limnocylindria bacterium]